MSEPQTPPTEDFSIPLAPPAEALGLVRLKAERIQVALLKLPGWLLATDGLAISRPYELPTNEAATTFLCLIVELSRAQAHDAKLLLFGRRLTVTLTSPEAGGVTEADLDLARQISFAA